MNEARVSEQRSVSIPASLADIAHELSSIQDWQDRISDSLSFLNDLLSGSTVALGVCADHWEVFCGDNPPGDPKLVEDVLLQHFRILTGQERAEVLVRVASEGSPQPAIRETEGVLGSFLSVPVVGADEVVGVLHVRTEERDAYSVDDVTLVSIVASQIGSYVSNVLAYRREQNARREIEQLKESRERQLHILQQALLPSESHIGDGYDVGSLYRPAFAGEEIGGDFLDVSMTEDDRVSIVIGDVSGKGIPAAALAAATRSTIRAFAYELSSPGKALAHANLVLSRSQIGLGRFVTTFLAILDPATGVVRYANAGHPPPVLYHKGAVELLTLGRPPLGVEPGSEFDEDETCLCPGDKLVLYTDGISEARREGELFGIERIAELVGEIGNLSPDEMVGRLVAAASTWADGQLCDDAAIVVIGRMP